MKTIEEICKNIKWS